MIPTNEEASGLTFIWVFINRSEKWYRHGGWNFLKGMGVVVIDSCAGGIENTEEFWGIP